MAKYTTHVETWNVRKQGRDDKGRFTTGVGTPRRTGRVVVRNADGTLHGATNYPLTSRVGQVATVRRG